MISIDKAALKTILAFSLDTKNEIDVIIERIEKESLSEQEAYNILQRKFKIPKKVDITEYMYLPEKL